MPGLLGRIHVGKYDETSVTSNNQLDGSDFSQKWVVNATCRYRFDFAKNSRTFARFEENRTLVAYEGTLLDQQATPQIIAKNLYQKYIRNGENFVKELRGSFQIFVVDSREFQTKCYLYVDHTASRPIFYSCKSGYFNFSPDIEMLFADLKNKTIDEMAMVHFMIAGHFPANHTAINEIKVLGPGEYLKIEDNNIQKRRYFQFKIQPDEKMNNQAATRLLDRVLKERIIEHWRCAQSPAILLSGGFDSQYIFYTIAESVEDTSKLITVTWGQNPGKRYADMRIARHTAKRFGTHHIEIIKTLNGWQSAYNEMFIAQNGMTASSFYHAQELSICKILRKQYGIRSIMRGDECLGYGPDALNIQDALIANSMSRPEYIPGLADWFKSGNHIAKAYSIFVEGFVEKYRCQSYNSLKDTLDFYERQNMNRNPLNYYKLHYLDVFCPLIDVDVLELFTKLPVKFRRHKQLFKNILKTKVGKKLKIAEYTNLTNWRKAISNSNDIKNYFIEEYKYLPEFLDHEYFYKQLSLLKNERINNVKNRIKYHIRPIKKVLPIETLWQSLSSRNRSPYQQMHIPSYMLLIRASVLARWNKLWIHQDLYGEH